MHMDIDFTRAYDGCVLILSQRRLRFDYGLHYNAKAVKKQCTHKSESRFVCWYMECTDPQPHRVCDGPGPLSKAKSNVSCWDHRGSPNRKQFHRVEGQTVLHSGGEHHTHGVALVIARRLVPCLIK